MKISTAEPRSERVDEANFRAIRGDKLGGMVDGRNAIVDNTTITISTKLINSQRIKYYNH